MGWIYNKSTDSFKWKAGEGAATPNESVERVQQTEKVLAEGKRGAQKKKAPYERGNLIQQGIGAFRESRKAILAGRTKTMREQTQKLKAERRMLKEEKDILGLRSEIEKMHSAKKEKRKAIDDLFGFG